MQLTKERSAVEWSGVEWSGVEWSGVEWSGVEWTDSIRSDFAVLNQQSEHAGTMQ